MERAKECGCVKVGLVSNHLLLCEGVRRILSDEGDIEVVFDVESVTEAQRLVKDGRGILVIMMVELPRKVAEKAVRELMDPGEDVRVLVMDIAGDRELVFNVLHAGASGYLPRSADSSELIHAVREVSMGQRFVSRRVRSLLVDQYVFWAGDGESRQALTQREEEVLTGLAVGRTNREIAKELFISVKTVDAHRGNILRKLELRNNSDITRYAIRKGFVRADSECDSREIS